MPMLLGITFSILTWSWIPLIIGGVAQWIFGNMIIPTLIVIALIILLTV